MPKQGRKKKIGGLFLGYVELGREWERKEKGNVVLIGPKILDVKILRIKLMVGPSLVEIGRIVLSYLGQVSEKR